MMPGGLNRGVVVVAAALALGGCAASRTPSPPSPPTSPGPEAASPAPPGVLRLSTPRAVHRATRLADGSVLLTGGCTQPGCGGFERGRTAERFAEGRLTVGAQMASPRASGTATLMRDGRVLLTGGFPGEGQAPTPSAEVYEPASGRFLPVADLAVGRADHSASLLTDGRVLVAGGFDAAGRALRSTEIYDPSIERFTTGAALTVARAAHVAVTVGERVILLGGTTDSAAMSSTDVGDGDSWRPGPPLQTPRVKLGAALMPDGRVFVAGGSTDTQGRERLSTTELLDLARPRTTPGPSLSAGEYKLDGALAVLADGRVVVPSAGGLDVFDPATSTMQRLPDRTYAAGSFRTVTAVSETAVLVAGGYDASVTPTDQVRLIDVGPAAGSP